MIRRPLQIGSAFLQLGLTTATKYPLGFLTQQLAVLLPILIYFFIARLVGAEVPAVGGDYFTYVMVGLVGMHTLNAGLRALSNEIDLAVSRGWFEMILMEPIPWPLLPFAMSMWPVVNALFAASVVIVVALITGASVNAAGMPLALLIIVVSILAGLSIGSLAASVKVLAKRGDPILALYSMSAMIFSGLYFPIDQLPSALRPISYLYAHTYVLSGLRHALLLTPSDLGGLGGGQSLAALFILAVGLMPIALYSFHRAMQFGRRMGLLAGY